MDNKPKKGRNAYQSDERRLSAITFFTNFAGFPGRLGF
jgi:hypothetical protein